MTSEPAGPASILLVDDEAALREPLGEYLVRQGFVVSQASSAAEARTMLLNDSPDLVLLDVMMPGEDGLSLCRHLIESKELPVILLTAKGEAMDRIIGLEIGADDYVVKPFEPRELVARIKSVLRRSSRSGSSPQEDAHYEFEGWQLDPVKRRLTATDGAVVPISAAEFRLLVAFLNHPRQVLDRDRLLDMVQGREAHLFDRAVDNQVSRLRRKIEGDSREPRLIQTVRGGGYVLAADVRRTLHPRHIGQGNKCMKVGLWPRSLLGQMLLAVAVALLVAQALSAVLLYRATEQRREAGTASNLAFQLVSEPRFDYRQSDSRYPGDSRRQHWRKLRVERTLASPLRPGETIDPARETLLRNVLTEQGIDPADLVVTVRKVRDDAYVMERLRERESPPEWSEGDMIVAGLQQRGDAHWTVARVPVPKPDAGSLGGLISQTVILYVVLVGGLAVLLRRITRPLAALTTRLEYFSQTQEISGQLVAAGPEDTRRLIAAHNAMEARIIALLDEKDVMLGAIGHDLKTPLSALRVRIESVEDDTERARMATTIEDITRTLDDILSLARVGRPSDDPENTELAALTASVVEEFEDMGEDVELADASRIAVVVRATWLRRALRNLVANALRYGGGKARVSLVRERGVVIFRVEDDGPGIAEHELEAMLEPFRRGETSRSRETGGAGLGLTLARAIADQHGGSLRLVNRYDRSGKVIGLTAEIRLPA